MEAGIREEDLLFLNDIPSIFEKVESDVAKYGLVPLENSLEGSVNLTLDLLAKSNLLIKEEIIIEITHCLLGKEGANTEDIEVILSHPHAIAQVRDFLREKFPRCQFINTLSTSEAALKVSKEKNKNIAAIASPIASEIYALKILIENIPTPYQNFTRFVIIGKEDSKPSGYDKTSIAFGLLENKPGSLYKALEPFALKNINLTKIESRPSKRVLGEYIFFVDLEGHREDKKVKEALEELKPKTEMLKIFGSYRRGDI